MADEIRKVVGYRGLNKAERDFLDRIRAKGKELYDLISEMSLASQRGGQVSSASSASVSSAPSNSAVLDMASVPADIALDDAPAVLNQRWIALAQKQLALGMQSLERAVTNPTSF